MPDDPIGLSENDATRSHYARNLIETYRVSQTGASATLETIPRVLLQFWDDLARIPDDVQECMASWLPLKARGFSIVYFGDASARAFIASEFGQRELSAFDRCHHPAMRCDYFRLCYMIQNGGFYVDADEVYQGVEITHLFTDRRLKLQPLCYDLRHDVMVPPDDYFQGDDASQRIYYFNNNPIIAPAHHPVLVLALQRATRILHTAKLHRDIQSTTGPGNMTASLVRYALDKVGVRGGLDIQVLIHWNSVSISKWPLSYRNDSRNWRLADRGAI